MDVLLEPPPNPPPPPLETSRTFFDFAKAPGALSILILGVVPGPDEHTYILKYKNTIMKMLDFCIICIDGFNIKNFHETLHDFSPRTSQAPTPPPLTSIRLLS